MDKNTARLPADLVNGRADIITHTQYHYNPSRDVVARVEFIPEAQFKVRLRV